jgi:hypothetical protein
LSEQTCITVHTTGVTEAIELEARELYVREARELYVRRPESSM